MDAIAPTDPLPNIFNSNASSDDGSSSSSDDERPVPRARIQGRIVDFILPRIFYPGGDYALDGIALRGNLLGVAIGLSGSVAYAMWSNNGFWQLPLFVLILAVFHFLEFWVTARFNTSKAEIDAFLLSTNGIAYNAAHTSAFIEALIEWIVQPSLKRHPIITLIGIFLVIFGQVIRALAMAHASTNFNHQVATNHRHGHVLIKNGVYKYWRHPSYFGFFWWGLGTQLLLANPICFIGYAVVLWRFFQARITREEKYLITFFGKEYEDYKKATYTFIPFIR